MRAPASVVRFQPTKMTTPVTQNPTRAARSLGLRERDGGRLVDRDPGGGDPPAGCPPAVDDRLHPHAVDDVADAEHRRRRDRRAARGDAAAREHADEGELRAAREHHEAEEARLPDVEARGDGEGSERDAVGGGREADGEAVAHGARRRAVVAGIASAAAPRRRTGRESPLSGASDDSSTCLPSRRRAARFDRTALVAPPLGLEPRTYRLTADCSAN